MFDVIVLRLSLQQVEMEAMAVSRIGGLYDKVLKLKSRAKDYFKLCMQLAVSMHPRNFSGESMQTLQRNDQLLGT